ncbi:hypothetical protein ES879_20995 [Salmonella enterica]|nr:hypothetical protein [Salmonella enterica]
MKSNRQARHILGLDYRISVSVNCPPYVAIKPVLVT